MEASGGECVLAENKSSWYGPGLAVLIIGFLVFGALCVLLVVGHCRRALRGRKTASSGYSASKVYIPGVDLLK